MTFNPARGLPKKRRTHHHRPGPPPSAASETIQAVVGDVFAARPVAILPYAPPTVSEYPPTAMQVGDAWSHGFVNFLG